MSPGFETYVVLPSPSANFVGACPYALPFWFLAGVLPEGWFNAARFAQATRKQCLVTQQKRDALELVVIFSAGRHADNPLFISYRGLSGLASLCRMSQVEPLILRRLPVLFYPLVSKSVEKYASGRAAPKMAMADGFAWDISEYQPPENAYKHEIQKVIWKKVKNILFERSCICNCVCARLCTTCACTHIDK